jgi:hypothetical protein
MQFGKCSLGFFFGLGHFIPGVSLGKQEWVYPFDRTPFWRPEKQIPIELP